MPNLFLAASQARANISPAQWILRQYRDELVLLRPGLHLLARESAVQYAATGRGVMRTASEAEPLSPVAITLSTSFDSILFACVTAESMSARCANEEGYQRVDPCGVALRRRGVSPRRIVGRAHRFCCLPSAVRSLSTGPGAEIASTTPKLFAPPPFSMAGHAAASNPRFSSDLKTCPYRRASFRDR
jgi:hypothetical protein